MCVIATNYKNHGPYNITHMTYSPELKHTQ